MGNVICTFAASDVVAPYATPKGKRTPSRSPNQTSNRVSGNRKPRSSSEPRKRRGKKSPSPSARDLPPIVATTPTDQRIKRPHSAGKRGQQQQPTHQRLQTPPTAVTSFRASGAAHNLPPMATPSRTAIRGSTDRAISNPLAVPTGMESSGRSNSTSSATTASSQIRVVNRRERRGSPAVKWEDESRPTTVSGPPSSEQPLEASTSYNRPRSDDSSAGPGGLSGYSLQQRGDVPSPEIHPHALDATLEHLSPPMVCVAAPPESVKPSVKFHLWTGLDLTNSSNPDPNGNGASSSAVMHDEGDVSVEDTDDDDNDGHHGSTSPPSHHASAAAMTGMMKVSTSTTEVSLSPPTPSPPRVPITPHPIRQPYVASPPRHSNNAISMDAVRQNDGKHGRRAWTIIHGVVFDITDFHRKHPGGASMILQSAGKDGTVVFNGSHHGGRRAAAFETMIQRGMRIGELES